ncbi:unnamed protein product [Spirodela intermedia]|uniref:RRM domain-containing protein n=1 Tax=Spirodela intermedia TaxID=51605 RepID=A0A7I8I7V8_SPIIN|nr:unnamed protein product [Spirodela intermedia]CAA6653727.1 unnamed protein product [Spirodela intermedia]
MPPRRSIGARKKIVKTTRAVRKTATSKAAAAAAADTAHSRRRPSHSRRRPPIIGSPADVETVAADTTAIVDNEATGGSPFTEGRSPPAASQGQSADWIPDTDAAPGPSEEAREGADGGAVAGVEEPAASLGKTSEVAEVATKSPAARTTKRVRKVTRKVPVKITPRKVASAVVEEENETGGRESAPTASMEGDEKPIGTEATVSESVEEKNLSCNPGQLSAPQGPTSHEESNVSSATDTCAEGATSIVVPQKKVRKVKRIVLVKKYVKKVKVSHQNEKLEETEGTVGEKLLISGNDAEANKSTEAMGPDLEAESASAADGALKMDQDIMRGTGHYESESGDAAGIEAGLGEGAGTSSQDVGDEMMGMSERQKRKKTEIFIGGLDKNAMEDDIRKVFGKVGEIVEVRMMMDGKTGKNKGYAFLRYATAAQAKQAVTEFSKVEVCGKQCGAAALQGNDTLFLGNIDKTWKKDDVTKILSELGIDKIDSMTLMPDPKDPNCNRGFAFLDFETNKDAQIAFKKLQKKDAFGKGRIVKVAWAEPINDPDEEEMQKVKSVFAEGIPLSWDEKKVRECFKMYGQIERVVLSRNMHSAKRKDFAFINFTTREAALSCIESFDKDMSINSAQIEGSLAKPMQKGKKSKAGTRTSEKDNFKGKPKTLQLESSRLSGDTKLSDSIKGQTSMGVHADIREDKASTTREFLHVLREQASWKQMNYPRDMVPRMKDLKLLTMDPVMEHQTFHSRYSSLMKTLAQLSTTWEDRECSALQIRSLFKM